ncbi:MAG: biotin--[Clostridia bacterium]|nr:biotin--[acetyl-CoA-carboxylase] ligase [Clostridia bacterium]
MQLENLNCNFLGKTFSFYEEIDSTQDEIWRLIKKNEIENGQLVATNIQTNGKGTHGRTWHTDEVNNVAFSFYIEMNTNVEVLEGITYEIAEILVNIFKAKYNVQIKIKEPNDLVCNGKKIGGILTEAKILANQVKYLVIGIGINTNKLYFSDDIKDIATSIKKEFNIEINSLEFISEFCNKFEKIIQKRSE